MSGQDQQWHGTPILWGVIERDEWPEFFLRMDGGSWGAAWTSSKTEALQVAGMDVESTMQTIIDAPGPSGVRPMCWRLLAPEEQ